MRRAVVLGCALIALAGACSSPEEFSGGPRTTTTTAQPATPDTTAPDTDTTDPGIIVDPELTVPTTTTPPADSLASLMITAVPSGYAQQIDTVADTGPTDLAKAARDDINPNARRALLVTGFVRGYQRLWSGLDPTGGQGQNLMYLYEFQSPVGAAGYAERWRLNELANASSVRPSEFEPAYMPGSAGIRVQDKTGSTGIVIFSKGVYAVRAIVNGFSQENPSGAVTQLALAEYLRLP